MDKIAKKNRDTMTILSRRMTWVKQVVQRTIWPQVMCRVLE